MDIKESIIEAMRQKSNVTILYKGVKESFAHTRTISPHLIYISNDNREVLTSIFIRGYSESNAKSGEIRGFDLDKIKSITIESEKFIPNEKCLPFEKPLRVLATVFDL